MPSFPLRTFAALSLLASVTSLGACASAPTEEGDDGAESALRALGANEKVGDIAFGETKTVAYSETPLYRALRVSATKGDVIDAWVRSGSGLDAKAWIVNAASRTLASNDDADGSTRDAHVTAKASATADYYLVFRDKNGEDGTFSVSLAGRATPPLPTTTTTTPPPPVPTGLAGLPDGTYRIPTTSYINTNAACKERFDLFTVRKTGAGFTVDGVHVTITDPRGIGSVASGRFHGESIYDPCSYCSDSHATKYTMDGELTYDGTRLSLTASYTGSWTNGKTWSGSIDNTWFGRDESTLPASVQRATLTLGPRYDGCAGLWTATVVRLADGTRLMSLPDYYGDVPITNGAAAITSCARRGASLSLHGATVSSYQSLSSTTCSDSATVPAWFAE